MKTICILVAAALLAGCQREKSTVAQAYESVTNVCLEKVCGFQKIVSLDWDWGSGGKGPGDWKVVATAEYINTRGGYERTNLPIKLGSGTNDGVPYVYAYVDDMVIIQREQAEFEKQHAIRMKQLQRESEEKIEAAKAEQRRALGIH